MGISVYPQGSSLILLELSQNNNKVNYAIRISKNVTIYWQYKQA